MRRNWFHSMVCVWAATTVAFGGCRTPVATLPIAPKPVQVAPAIALAMPVSTARATVALEPPSDQGVIALALPDAKPAPASSAVTTLSAGETQALLARLEPLPDLSGQPAPVVRPPSIAPPRSGTTQPIAFVVPSGKTVADMPMSKAPVVPLPLAEPDILPAGEIQAESEIRLRFDEPMIAVAAVGTAASPPATITPAIAGTWRWIDTRVASFTASGPKLPQATEFTVTVAAGMRAISGAVLGRAVTQTFATTPVMIAGTFPTTPLRPDSPLAVKFDQAVDPTAIARFLRVASSKGTPLAVQTIALADAQRLWLENPSLKFDVKELGANFVILAPKTAWPAGLAGHVALAVGAPSKEGPRITTRETGAAFDVVKPFTVRGISCDEMAKPRMTGAACAALGWISVEFSNSISPASIRSSKVQVVGEPTYDDKHAGGSAISLPVPGTAGRTFSVAVGDGLIDIYGQPLVGGRGLSFFTKVQRIEPYITVRTGLYILDPRFEIPQWLIEAQAVTSLHVQLYQVQPKDYFAYLAFEAGKRATPPGKRVYDKTHAVGARFAAEERVDLRPALGAAGTGHVIAVLTAAANGSIQNFDKRGIAWIQVSKLGLAARVDREKVSAWVEDITPTKTFLAPVAGVMTSLLVDKRADAPAPVATDAQGHASFELLPSTDPAKRPEADSDLGAIVVAQSATDSVFTALAGFYEKAIRSQNALWYVTDDRFTYKPGETVYVKGWVRWTHNGVNPDLALPATTDTVAYTVTDSRQNKVAAGVAQLTDQGGFDLEVTLPPNVGLGTASLTFTTKQDESHSHPIAIEEFRTPAFAVTLNDDVTHGGATPVIVGESIEMRAEAKYYTGGGLGGASISWSAELSPSEYRPAGWDGFAFTPVRKRSESFRYYGRHHRTGGTTAHVSSRLAGASTSTVVIGIGAVPRNEPAMLAMDATVRDIDRATIRATSRSILVHPSSYYVGLRQRSGGTGVLEVVVTDVDGAAVTGVAVDVAIEGVLGSELDRDDAAVIDTQRCKVTSAADPVTCAYKRRDLKTAYAAVARVADARGRTNATQYAIPWWSTDEATADLAIVPDRAEYRPGDVAKLEIRSAIVPATAVVTFARQGVIVQKRIELTAQSTMIELPIEESYLQNVHVIVDRWSSRTNLTSSSPPPLPRFSRVERSLPVDLEFARLTMATRATKKVVRPGEQATFEVTVRHAGKAVPNAEVALMVVDEAVLALSARSHADPLESFFTTVDDGTAVIDTFGMVEDEGPSLAGKPGFVRHNLDELTGHYAVGGGRGGMRGRTASVPSVRLGSVASEAVARARKDFRATAVFSPRLKTDANGKALVSVKMPDSLTRFRVVALATANTRFFGKAENTIITQLAVNARTVVPRFLTQGDAFSLPVVVQNLDTTPRTIDVAVRAANLTSVGPAGKRVTVPAGQRAEVRFEFTTKVRGRALVQTIASSNEFVDASNVEIPVYEPATTESFATYGAVDDAPQFEQLAVPAEIFPEVGGVEAELASTQLQSLTDAFWYLYGYPYECAEQRSGRMLATSAMYDILDAFSSPGRPTRAEVDTLRAADVKKLTKDQNGDGGWGYWGDMQSDRFVTLQVLAALAVQQVGGSVMKAATAFVTKDANTTLASLEASVKQPAAARRDQDDAFRVSLVAAALTSLAAAGLDVRPRAARLHAAATALGSYPIDAKARVLALVAKQAHHQVVRAKLLPDLLSNVHETAAAATVTAKFTESERLLLGSSTRTTALVLDAIMREAPEHPLVLKLARGVLDARRNGRWTSTQENLVVLQAMRRYFDLYEKATPNYTGKLWFGTAAYAEQAFVGRSNARGTVKIDWPTLPPGTTHDIAVQKSGPGRMYYRIGITYAPKQTNLPALDAGFIVRRSYTAVDDPADVTQTKDGRWKIKLGARVLVQLETLNTTRRHAVALVDPLPAGFETVNTRLATAERAAAGATDADWEHITMRDNRSEAFAMTLAEGTHRFAYTVRATTPGTFIAAPTKAEEMYNPETFGRSGGTTIVIE